MAVTPYMLAFRRIGRQMGLLELRCQQQLEHLREGVSPSVPFRLASRKWLNFTSLLSYHRGNRFPVEGPV